VRPVPPLHDSFEDAGGDHDAVLAPGGARYRTRAAGVPPLLASHAPSSAGAEETFTGDLALRLESGRRAPVRALMTPTKKDCDVTRRDARLSSFTLGSVGRQRALCEAHGSELRILRKDPATDALARARLRAGAWMLQWGRLRSEPRI
jgi:hypothetical protein